MESTQKNPISFSVLSVRLILLQTRKNDHEVRTKMHLAEHPVRGILLGKCTRRGKHAVTLIENVLSASDHL